MVVDPVVKRMAAKEVSNSWFPAPKMWWARFSRRMETPIVLMRGASGETPVRPRRGRRATRSSRYPSAAVPAKHDMPLPAPPRSAEELELPVPDDEHGGFHDNVALLVEGKRPEDAGEVPDPRGGDAQPRPGGL